MTAGESGDTAIAQPHREFEAYQVQSKNLFVSERRWARFKDFGLRLGEPVLKILLLPFILIIAPFKFVYQKCAKPAPAH